MSVFAKAKASRSARAAWTGLAIAGVSTLLLSACATGGTPPAETEEPAETGDAQPIEAFSEIRKARFIRNTQNCTHNWRFT